MLFFMSKYGMRLTHEQALLLEQIRKTPVSDFTWEFQNELNHFIQDMRSKRDYAEMAKSDERSKLRAIQETKRRQKAIKLAKTLKVGDVVKMRGVRDGKGYRLVLEIRDHDVVCRKLKLVNKVMFESEVVWYMPKSTALVCDEYITTHGKDKLHSILGHPIHRYRT